MFKDLFVPILPNIPTCCHKEYDSSIKGHACTFCHLPWYIPNLMNGLLLYICMIRTPKETSSLSITYSRWSATLINTENHWNYYEFQNIADIREILVNRNFSTTSITGDSGMFSHLGLEGLLTIKCTESHCAEQTKRDDSSPMPYRRGTEQTKIGTTMPCAREVRRQVIFREEIYPRGEEKFIESGSDLAPNFQRYFFFCAGNSLERAQRERKERREEGI